MKMKKTSTSIRLRKILLKQIREMGWGGYWAIIVFHHLLGNRLPKSKNRVHDHDFTIDQMVAQTIPDENIRVDVDISRMV